MAVPFGIVSVRARLLSAIGSGEEDWMSRLARLGWVVGALLVLPGASVGSALQAPPSVTHGVMVGDVTASSAVL
jgi:hypothetical protein